MAGKDGAPSLLVRHIAGPGPSVIYVHGATFPTALSVAYRFRGRSWMDDLAARGFDVWGFDFAGYGGSDRYPEMLNDDPTGAPLGRAEIAGQQLARVVDRVLEERGGRPVSLIAHSWGTMVAGRYAANHPDRVARLALFGPFSGRIIADSIVGQGATAAPSAWVEVSIADQLHRFASAVPAGHPPVLIEPELARWGPAYLATDSGAAARNPPAVRIPAGWRSDIAAAHAGKLPYDCARILAPTLIVFGSWEVVCTRADAAWLGQHLGSRDKRIVEIPGATHLMHLEEPRDQLFEATGRFLAETY